MKSVVINKAEDARDNEIKPGDYVAYIADSSWDPFISFGTITKLYISDPEEVKNHPASEMWNTKATIKDDNGRIYPNIQIRRIVKL